MSCSKKQKHLENDQEMDGISNLPDTLLCHILSFVPTKSAVATSILSRRWISLWTKVPVLDFSEFPRSLSVGENEIKKFISFIKKVMLHNSTPCLQRLYFEAVQESDINHVDSMVDSVLKREIWEIHFNRQWAGGNNVPMQLPTSLFVRERLMVLKINGRFSINVPLSLHLPRLETLYFRHLNFVGQDVLNIVNSGCSALKEMVIEYCTGLRMLHIDSLTLSRLRTIGIRNVMIAVKGPNIRLLHLEYATVQFDISDLSSLIEATIDVYADRSRELPDALELIRRISHVQILRLAQTAVELFGRVGENELPTFPNLRRLEIQITYSMFQILNHLPKLKHLIMDMGISMTLSDDLRPFPSEIVPQCLLSLQYIEIQRFGCYGNDTELVRYILKNATALKELKIHMRHTCMQRERDAYKKLLSIPRFSTCQVIVCSDRGEYNFI